MPELIPVVEGDGEVDAFPILLRRLLHNSGRFDWTVAKPKNAHGCGSLTVPGGIERFVTHALREPGCAGVIVLIDNDAVRGLQHERHTEEDCAPALARSLAERSRGLNPAVPVSIVVARWEYEVWLLASLETIRGKSIKGQPGLDPSARYEGDVETEHSPKGWLERHMPPGRKYLETRDQAPLTDLLDIEVAKGRSRSFARLMHAVNEIIEAHERGINHVTPA